MFDTRPYHGKYTEGMEVETENILSWKLGDLKAATQETVEITCITLWKLRFTVRNSCFT